MSHNYSDQFKGGTSEEPPMLEKRATAQKERVSVCVSICQKVTQTPTTRRKRLDTGCVIHSWPLNNADVRGADPPPPRGVTNHM